MAKRLSTMTIAELRAEINRRRKGLPKLRQERAKLVKQLAAVDRKIATLAGEAGAPVARARAPKARKPAPEPVGKRRLPKNTKPLVEYAADVLAKAKGGMRVKDVMVAVKEAGYKTGSKDFYGLVAAALQDKRFGKVGRGVYALKAQKTAAKRGRKKAAKQEAPASA